MPSLHHAFNRLYSTEYASEAPGGLVGLQASGQHPHSFWLVGSEQGYESTFSNGFPGDAGTADLEPHFEVLRTPPTSFPLQTFCQFSQLEPLNSHVILPHAGRRNTGLSLVPYDDVTLRWIWGGQQGWAIAVFYSSVLYHFQRSLLETLFPLGLRHFDFPCPVASGSGRLAGKFTSHTWESTWLPFGHLWPCGHLTLLACLRQFLASFVVKTFKFAFSVPVSVLASVILGPDFKYPRVPTALLFKHGLFIQLNNTVAISMTAGHSFPLSVLVCLQTPSTPGSISLSVWDSVLGCLFPLWIISFLVRSCTLAGIF